MEINPLVVAAATLLCFLQLAVGFLIGWASRGRKAPKTVENTTNFSAARDQELQRAQSIITNVHLLTADVGDDVSEHAATIARIGKRLEDSEGGSSSPEAVATAVGDILSANKELKQRLKEAEAKLAEQSSELRAKEAAAMTDALTGVPNRRAWDEQLARQRDRFERRKSPSAVIMIDVDHFKKFNDTHGHQVGDQVLKEVATTLVAAARDSDFVARYGGEEFGVILPNTDLTDAQFAAGRLRRAIEGCQIVTGSNTLRVTASLGVAPLQADELSEAWVQRADSALYAAKKSGRNRTYVHTGNGLVAACEVPEPPANAAALAEAERRKFYRKQPIAPWTGAQLPAPEDYRDVVCQALSTEGVTFLQKTPPDFTTLVVALGEAPNFHYLKAEITKVEPVAIDYGGGYRVHCKFLGRAIAGQTAQPASAIQAPVAPIPAGQGAPSLVR
jgi:diguanylate cyclase (GGDEF)-like protein